LSTSFTHPAAAPLKKRQQPAPLQGEEERCLTPGTAAFPFHQHCHAVTAAPSLERSNAEAAEKRKSDHSRLPRHQRHQEHKHSSIAHAIVSLPQLIIFLPPVAAPLKKKQQPAPLHGGEEEENSCCHRASSPLPTAPAAAQTRRKGCRSNTTNRTSSYTNKEEGQPQQHHQLHQPHQLIIFFGLCFHFLAYKTCRNREEVQKTRRKREDRRL
jgi:hypothetical protein